MESRFRFSGLGFEGWWKVFDPGPFLFRMDKLWRELLSENTLVRGWHLARLETRQDFAEDLYSTDVYGLDLKINIQETISRLSTHTWQPRPLMRMEVPKGSLSFRPGAVIPIHDRVVASAIVLLLAPDIDSKIPDNVYSWRVKKPLPKSGPIFRESDITDLPFLKKATIKRRVDPFEPWYGLWPEFDEESRSVFLDRGYRYLATSDISAYFENIQLPILRDHLLRHLPNNAQLVNLLCVFLESWTIRTSDGRPHLRGIPQGNFISSFLGNFFLLPLDERLVEFTEEHDVLYYRYMDDVRIFTKAKEHARLAVFLMDRTLRELHLNVQSAKTKIYDEASGEVSDLIIDARVDNLTSLVDDIQTKFPKGDVPAPIRSKYLAQLSSIAHIENGKSQRIVGSRRPLDGLTLRAFNRWATAHGLLGSDQYVGRLMAEIERSADYKLTKKLVSATRQFPRRTGIQNGILTFLISENNIFPYQEAECLRALRYLSRINERTRQHCVSQLRAKGRDRYIRMQAAYLLARCTLTQRQIVTFEHLFDNEPDPYVKVALSCLLVQRRYNDQEIIRKLVFHPNEKVRGIGKLFRTIKTEVSVAKARLAHMFRPEVPWLACDNMPFVHLMASSQNPKIRRALLDAIRQPRLDHPIIDVREALKQVFTRTRESLREDR